MGPCACSCMGISCSFPWVTSQERSWAPWRRGTVHLPIDCGNELIVMLTRQQKELNHGIAVRGLGLMECAGQFVGSTRNERKQLSQGLNPAVFLFPSSTFLGTSSPSVTTQPGRTQPRPGTCTRAGSCRVSTRMALAGAHLRWLAGIGPWVSIGLSARLCHSRLTMWKESHSH